MPDPLELLGVARNLAAADDALPPAEAQLRRAVSTAYYALFHKVSRAGADRFIGSRHESRPGYAMIYRGFNHGRMKSVCAAINVARLGPTLRRQLQVEAVSRDMRGFAEAFLSLQDNRVHADYDPHATFGHPDAVDAVNLAELAVQAFDRTTADEQTDVLALMLVNFRD